VSPAVGLALDWLAGRRFRQLERIWRDPIATQEHALRSLVRHARDTSWGRAHDFAGIRGVADYQQRVALSRYATIRPLVDRIVEGEPDVLWPGRTDELCKTSGTTGGDKLIPLTREARRAHRRGGLDALLFASRRVGGARRLDGPMLFLGGSTHTEAVGAGVQVGDLSGLMARRLPRWARYRHVPGSRTAAIPDWERRIEATAAAVWQQDLRLIAGMPSWMLVLFDRIRQRLPDPDWPLGRLWPNLDVFIHGGVRMAPYRRVLETTMGRRLHLVEVYPASEGFVAAQVHPADPGLTLMLDHGLFYEFVPVAALDHPDPPRLTVADIHVGEIYAICLTTPAGLWSYLLGDTVRVVRLDPPQVVITGRIHHFVNAFGENVIVEEVEQAVARACAQTGSEVVEFTVAPVYPDGDAGRARHEWVVEFRRAPTSLADFNRVLDAALAGMNTDYRTKRAGEVGMAAPVLSVVPTGTFHRWLAGRGQLGDQHKVPRVANHRDVLDGVLAAARVGRDHPVPILPGGDT
jgi:hypothetical protein